jgi:hypothetical protein
VVESPCMEVDIGQCRWTAIKVSSHNAS